MGPTGFAPSADSRTLRIFISSTFRDMQGEREQLVKFAFPELRRRCRERGVELVEVDLRWGITEAQAERGEVLPVCLAEIRRCDYFVGLLGERFGFVPQHIDPALLDEQPWLAEHSAQSYTALEILHGVLNAAAPAGRAFFYFRDPGYLERLPPETQRDHGSESPEAGAKLATLKAQIREGAEQGRLTLRTDYPNPATVAEWIRDDLWQAIDARYPEGSAPDPLDREAAEHAAFAASRARVYVPRDIDGRKVDLERLDAHAAGEGPPLVLVGESGVGKSALLANWARRYREDHADAFVLEHYLGSSPGSAEHVALMRRICEEIKRHFEASDQIPATPEKLREALPIWLATAHAKGGMVLILDALNQLEDRDNAPDLGWLPAYIPPKVRLICSTLPGRGRDAVEKREWPTHEITALTGSERRELIDAFLGHYGKRLSNRQVTEITNVPQTRNPLYLRALLEELRVLGSRHNLDIRIGECLKAPNPKALFERILERMEGDYQGPRPGLVSDALSLLWAARRGLAEAELLSLLGREGEPLPQAYWSPLCLALSESLTHRSGMLRFFHDYLRQAAHDRYLPDAQAEQEAHRCLAEYFDRRPLDERQLDELPWQWLHADAAQKLKACLTHLDRFTALHAGAKTCELMEYWQHLEPKYDAAKEYHAALARYEHSSPPKPALATYMNEVALFLSAKMRYRDAEALYRRALAMRVMALGANHPDTARSLSNLACALDDVGRYKDALTNYQRALEVQKSVLGGTHPDMAGTLNNIAVLRWAADDERTAKALLQQALAIMKKQPYLNHIMTSTILNNLAVLHWGTSDYKGAEALLRAAIALCEQEFGKEHPNTASKLVNLAGVLWAKGDPEDAERAYRLALSVFEITLGKEGLTNAYILKNLATISAGRGRRTEARKLTLKALQILKRAEQVSGLTLASQKRDVWLSSHRRSLLVAMCLSFMAIGSMAGMLHPWLWLFGGPLFLLGLIGIGVALKSMLFARELR